MPKINSECIEAAFNALKNFTKEELDGYVKDVFTRARSYDNLQNMRAFDQAMKEINDERIKSYFDDATTKANNIMKFEKNSKLIKDGKVDMRGLLAARGKLLAENVSGQQKAELETMVQHVFGDLSHEEMSQLTSGKLDEAITDAYDGKKVSDPFVMKMADKLRDYYTYRNSKLILSNAMKFEEINEDRFFRAVHDQTKIITAAKSLAKIAGEKVTRKYDMIGHREAWKNTIKKYLDMEKTFQHTDAVEIDGNLNLAEADKILDRIFNNITTGKSTIFTKSVVANDREAIKAKSRMFFSWKGLRAQYEYNKIYGKGNLYNMLVSDAQAASNKIGMAKKFGDNPQAMYNDLRRVSEETNPQGALWWFNTDNYFKQVKGEDKMSIAPTLSNFMANTRTSITMARLPLIALDSISDIGYIAAFAQRMGISYPKAWISLMTNIFDRYKTEDRVRIAKLFKTQIDSHLGYLGRWSEANNSSELLSKLSTKFFKGNFLEAFDRGNKIGMMQLMGKHIFENSNKSFESMNPSLQKWLGKFFTSDEWNLLRKKNKGGLFTTENVDNLSDAEIREHYQLTDKSIPLADVRDDLYRKVHSMFVIASENAVLSPTEFEKTFLHLGTSPGNPAGELLRVVTHFKMYTLAYIDRVLIQGFRDADTASQKVMWATSMLVGTIPLSVMSMYFHNLSMNLTMPSFDEMNVPQRYKYLMSILAPSLTMFSSMLDPKKQNAALPLSLLGSPSTSLIGNLLSAPLALAELDPKRAAKKLADAANYIFPIQTTPVISPIIHAILGDKAYLEPGQKHIFGQ